MTLAAIEPKALRVQTGAPSTPKGPGFSEIMSALAPAAAESTGLATNNANAASLTHAALTGAAVAAGPQTGAYGGTYGMSTQSPFSSAGYGVPDSLGTGYSSGTYAAGGSTGGFGAAIGGGSGLPTDPFMQQDYLLNKMRDTNMQMIQIQASIQHENRRWTTNSNILKAKHDTEMAQVRNFRVT